MWTKRKHSHIIVTCAPPLRSLIVDLRHGAADSSGLGNMHPIHRKTLPTQHMDSKDQVGGAAIFTITLFNLEDRKEKNTGNTGTLRYSEHLVTLWVGKSLLLWLSQSTCSVRCVFSVFYLFPFQTVSGSACFLTLHCVTCLVLPLHHLPAVVLTLLCQLFS